MRASAWSPRDPRSSCCPRVGGCSGRRTSDGGRSASSATPANRHTERKDSAMADAARARKLADRIKVIVAETLEKRVKDPRLGFVTVTDVRVTSDLQQATVYYTVLGDD